MKKWFLKLCRVVLALLGVAAVISCEDHLGDTPVMYGSPTSDYSVKGKVINMKHEALEGIKVKPLYDDYPDSTYTDAHGAFSIERKATSCVFWDRTGNCYVPFIVEDTTGTYFKDTVNVKLVQVKEGEGWYNGAYEAREAKITMMK